MHCDIGDWLMLRLLSKNMERKNFTAIVQDLKKEIENREKTEEVKNCSSTESDVDKRSSRVDYLYNVANYILE